MLPNSSKNTAFRMSIKNFCLYYSIDRFFLCCGCSVFLCQFAEYAKAKISQNQTKFKFSHRFIPDGNALVSNYEAFRFTESYGVIFQCNVKYCLGPCPPANCIVGRDSFESWGKKKRRRRHAEVQELDETATRLR